MCNHLLRKTMSSLYTNCTTKTLNRIDILDLKCQKIAEPSETPYLGETKIAKVKLPDEIAVPKITQKDITLSKEDATSDAILKLLKRYGICRIKNLFEVSDIDKINKDLDPFFEAKKNDIRLFPKETIRVTNTVSKSSLVVDKILSHPLNIEIANKTLDQANTFWIGENLNIGYCPSTVTSSISFQVSPHAAFQALHRDDQSDHNIRKVQNFENFDFNSETQIGFSVALTKATRMNGATRFIPGSHLWDHLQKPNEKDCFYNEMDKGDATFMLASVFHSASANLTENEVRRNLILFMGRGTCRQKENIYIDADLDYFRQFNVDQLKRLGFSMSEPFGNMVELQDPLTILKPEYKRKSNYSDICKIIPK